MPTHKRKASSVSSVRKSGAVQTIAETPAPKPEGKKLKPKETSVNGFRMYRWPLIVLLIAAAAYVYFKPTEKPQSSADNLLRSLFSKDLIEEDAARKAAVVAAFKHSWDAYSRDGFGFDNFHPISKTGSNIESKPIGYFIVDCLDSLLLFGMHDEYRKAREWVVKELSFDVDDKHHAFEVTIRVLGGLLAACHLSNGDADLLALAKDLGDRLLPIFNTPSGIPYSFINLKRRKAIPDFDNYNFASVAEAGTLQMELRYLSELSGDLKYWTPALRASNVIANAKKRNGLCPIFFAPNTGKPQYSDIRLGSRGDSYYEYLGKLYKQSNSTDIKWDQRYREALDGIQKHLLGRGAYQNSLHTVEMHTSAQLGSTTASFQIVRKQDHLVCFLPGLIFLGASHKGERYRMQRLSEKKLVDIYMAAELLETCVNTYTQTATGLAPEIVFFHARNSRVSKLSKMDWYIDKRKTQRLGGPKPTPPYDARNMLRPETLESLFVAYRMTGNPKYRDQAWTIFQAFEKHCRIPTGGYATILDVDEVPVQHEDKMETFWLSESLKYLFLIFSDESVVPLTKNVLTTEAHIFPVFDPAVTR